MKRCRAGVLLALLLAGCASEKGIIDRDGYQLDTRHPAQAAYPRIKVLVIHYTADDFDVSLATLTDNQVSSHYLIPEKPPLHGGKPRIWQLVPEEDLAWHAGVSFWRGSTRINDTSIGIELENRGWQKTAGGAGGWRMAGCPARGVLSAGASVIRAGRHCRAAGRPGALRLSGDAGNDPSAAKAGDYGFPDALPPRALGRRCRCANAGDC